ncbi:MAG: hypothetical protein JW888_04615 [Pirellulales bacterium]|nr:hypothetical protein [Pirellulales bacterium]
MRIRRKGHGQAFSSKDFLDIGSRASVDHALSTLTRSGVIRRVTRGIYDYPKVSPELGGQLSPDYDSVAQAIARKNGVRIEPSGAWAANLLGLSTQVPAKIVYLTNGTSREYWINGQKIAFQRVGPKELLPKPGPSTLVVQSLRHLGQDRIDDTVIRQLRDRLSPSDCKALLRDARYTADWIFEVLKKIVAD